MAQTGPNRALRLTFSYAGGDVRLESRQSLEMTAPPSHSREAMGDRLGFWYELRGASGEVLYRRIVDNPIRFSVEVRTDDRSRPLARQSTDAPQGRFVLLFPEIPSATTLVLVSSPLAPDGPREAARELARFDLRDPNERSRSPGR